MAGSGGKIPHMIMDYALYRNGERALDGSSISELIASARKDGGFVWVGVSEPTSAEFDGLVQDFHLHPLAVEDAIQAKQRPKLEAYEGMTFVVVRTTFYEESASQVTTGEILTFIGIITSSLFATEKVHLLLEFAAAWNKIQRY